MFKKDICVAVVEPQLWRADGGTCPRRSTLKLTREWCYNKILTRSVSLRLPRSEERQARSYLTTQPFLPHLTNTSDKFMAQAQKFCSLQLSAAANWSIGCKSLYSLSLWILMSTKSASEPHLMVLNMFLFRFEPAEVCRILKWWFIHSSYLTKSKILFQVLQCREINLYSPATQLLRCYSTYQAAISSFGKYANKGLW